MHGGGSELYAKAVCASVRYLAIRTHARKEGRRRDSFTIRPQLCVPIERRNDEPVRGWTSYKADSVDGSDTNGHLTHVIRKATDWLEMNTSNRLLH